MTTGLINLLEHAEKARLKKFLYISSSMVYGDFENDVTEDAECDPIGQYAIMKLMGEYLVKDYSRRTGMEYTIVRPSAVYGDWDVEDRVVSKFMLGAMRGDTLKVRGADEVLDFTYVKDTAMGIVQAALAANTHAKIYNITRSDSRLYTLLDAAKLAISIAKKGQIKIEGKDTEFPSRGRLSIDLARKDFGYDPKVSVEEGFELYHKWFKESTFWQTRI
jgi:nucleoside-diphosphate-sugar epimerase